MVMLVNVSKDFESSFLLVLIMISSLDEVGLKGSFQNWIFMSC